jgi:hypothetical protein
MEFVHGIVDEPQFFYAVVHPRRRGADCLKLNSFTVVILAGHGLEFYTKRTIVFLSGNPWIFGDRSDGKRRRGTK